MELIDLQLQRPGRDSNSLPRTLFVFLNELIDELLRIVDRLNDIAGKIDAVYPPSESSLGVKNCYAATLQYTIRPGAIISIEENYVPGSTLFVWDRRILIPKTPETELAGFYDYEEAENDDGTYSNILMRSGMRKGSEIVIWYTPS